MGRGGDKITGRTAILCWDPEEGMRNRVWGMDKIKVMYKCISICIYLYLYTFLKIH